MTLAELLERSLTLNKEQEDDLFDLLQRNKRKSEKNKISEIVRGPRLYTKFAGTEFAREINIEPFGISWTATKHTADKLKTIQKHLLGGTEC
jgi:hypothetical protein